MQGGIPSSYLLNSLKKLKIPPPGPFCELQTPSGEISWNYAKMSRGVVVPLTQKIQVTSKTHDTELVFFWSGTLVYM